MFNLDKNIYEYIRDNNGNINPEENLLISIKEDSSVSIIPLLTLNTPNIKNNNVKDIANA
jgi:hypothetical protein